MTTCLLLSHYGAVECLLTKFVYRTGFLDIVWAGAYTDEAIDLLNDPAIALAMVCLPPPGQALKPELVQGLQRHRALFVTAQYPEHLYAHYKLRPVAFLNEPFSFTQFQAALQICVDQETE